MLVPLGLTAASAADAVIHKKIFIKKYKGVYSRNNLPSTMKDGIYVLNLDEYKSIGTY